jgi:hypothetical protein
MTITSYWRGVLALALLPAFLSDCGGASQTTPTLMQQSIKSHLATSHTVRGAKSEDLVYATGGCGGVCIVTYPDGKLAGSISLTYPVGGDCSDSSGNVFVTNNTQVLEYAHGGTTPIATLSLPGVDAAACGVDAKTGNLAVIFGGGSAGNIAIFPGATGSPTLYTAGIAPYYCGYDNGGNLFVSGLSYQKSALVELPSGSSAFMTLTIIGDVGAPGQIQWDGKYVTYEGRDATHIKISRLSVSGLTATVTGQTHLKGARFAHQSWIAGRRVIVPHSTHGFDTNKISLWRYPKSGKPVVKFGNFGQSKQTQFFGVTLSKA